METAAEWMYIKEGNASVVIEHKTKHIIYQLWKCEAKRSTEKQSPQTSRESECRSKINFISLVLKPLLGQFANIPQFFPVTEEFVKCISQAFEKERPTKRRHKIIDPHQRFVVSQPNFCFLHGPRACGQGPTITIEIKPKRGFLTATACECKKDVCLFCMQQVLKQRDGDWDYTSKYCPIDLFSGDHRRMRHALEGLFETPQNNLVVFKKKIIKNIGNLGVVSSTFDSRLIYPGQGTSLPCEKERGDLMDTIHSWLGTKDSMRGPSDHFSTSASIQGLISLLITVLCKPDNNPSQLDKSRLSWTACSASSLDSSDPDQSDENKLPKGCVLHRILTTQHLNSYGIKFIHQVYQRYRTHLTKHPQDRERFSIDGPHDSDYLGTDLPLLFSDAEVPNLPMEMCVTLLRRYMVSRTVLDCSIMVTFQPLLDFNSDQDDVICLGDEKFLYSCNLIDLSPKSSSKIPHYYKQDELIRETYKKR
ncbi:inositol-pentakisphosphate 2-kinase-like [Diadema setosum]|uniref:inositol-pentakisphosphate 2-kinase-like n=1 Tax=Diadema setosum TaxID=31175 RepID=UPI003B3B1D1F